MKFPDVAASGMSTVYRTNFSCWSPNIRKVFRQWCD